MVKCGPKLLVPALGPGGGSFVGTHVSVRTGVCVCTERVESAQDASEVARIPGVISVCTVYEYARPLPVDGGG